jgi:hypothetical protein
MDFIDDFEDRVKQVEQYFEFTLLTDGVSQFRELVKLRSQSIMINNKKRYPLRYKINSQGVYEVNADLRKILKANCYLILYNLVEGSLVSALNAYFNAISSKQAKYQILTPLIKRVWIDYKYRLFKQHDGNQIVTVLDGLVNDIIAIEEKVANKKADNPKILKDYDAYRATVGKTDISGNIDARKIRELSKLYGFKLPKKNIM